MVYSVSAFVSNLTPFELTPAMFSTAVSWGSVTVTPQVVTAGQTDGTGGIFEAAAGTWTGTSGVSIYDWPGTGNIVLLIDMPYVGDNSCKMSLLPDDFFYPNAEEKAAAWRYGNWGPFGRYGGVYRDPAYLAAHWPNAASMVNKLASRDYGTDKIKGSDGTEYQLSCTIGQGTVVNANFNIVAIANDTAASATKRSGSAKFRQERRALLE